MSIQEIDLHHCGVERAICAYADAEQGWIVDPGPEVTAQTLRDALPDGFAARKILLTHIHFDHAGATGRLLEWWPEAEVWVHERGAPHMIDPSRLVASATRIYGDEFERLWGKVLPLPADRVRVLTGDEPLDGWQVRYTPGHASHHVSYLHESTGTAFVGDVAGVRIQEGPVFPPTPPPDIDLGLWHESIDLVQAWSPQQLALTHFGRWDDVDEHLGRLREQLDTWGDAARTSTPEEYADKVQAFIDGATTDPVTRSAYGQANPPSTLYAGMARYWAKKGERDHRSAAAE
ncbi:Hydroxyacylglutathione hydrolase [Paraconexibacter sp. AEG42_29]|uniref:Hydroxyacylglutathione hydrolase n=1 Tax=Paraconexibacter sp. AEG42_29 TaxID=2997339 RepID=A0AAU7ATE0_9ACTN